ncbi:MAG: hypothetical protein OXK21_03720 [Chloroflexota bacterium]|nr:hypothetical protein [Chloroflexota bacterium]
MANNRLEELRRRAQERIQQVREQMERGEDVAAPEPVPEPPPRAERRTEPPPPPTYEGQSLERPSL